jgi:hypothetical protein
MLGIAEHNEITVSLITFFFVRKLIAIFLSRIDVVINSSVKKLLDSPNQFFIFVKHIHTLLNEINHNVRVKETQHLLRAKVPTPKK